MAANKTRTQNFNKLAANAVKGYDFKNGRNASKSKYKTETEYQNSFDDILKFEKNFTEAQKKAINFVIYHDSNNDGVVSAYVAWKYLVKENKKDVSFFGLKPGFGANVNKRITNILDNMKGKNVLIVDLSYNKQTLDKIRNSANSLLVIDDHRETTEQQKDVFVGSNHSAVAYTWKFFYPKEKVPKIIQYVDDSDRKLFLPFVPFSNLFALSLGFRFVHNVFKTYGDKLFSALDELFKGDNPNFFVFIGKYYDEVRENIKTQIAANARTTNFQGYRVAILNMNAPGLTKVVGRQMVTNFAARGEPVDFAVLYGWEYSNFPQAYNVTLIDDHQQTKINMATLATKLGKISRHPKGAGGTTHEAHFYWTGDIFDLFKKKYI